MAGLRIDLAGLTLGTRRQGEIRLAHTPYFDIDEEALPVGVALLAQSVLRYLTSAVA